MKEETKKLFNAPWYVDIHAVDGIDGETYVFDGVYNDKCEPVCGNIQKHVTSNRITHLPELYEALIDAAYKTCHDCIYVTLKQDNVPLPNELIEKGCPMKFECNIKKAWEVLKKVKEGK